VRKCEEYRKQGARFMGNKGRSMKIHRSKEQISYTMSRIRSKDTSIELALRKALWKAGLRYRKHYRKVIGAPDIAFPSKKVAVFCDSSFWHGLNWENSNKKILSNRDYWVPKIEANIVRDGDVNQTLVQGEWIVLRFWDKDIQNNLDRCVEAIRSALREARPDRDRGE
jgi:DNA mismatch endonuclease (patch repair protein)